MKNILFFIAKLFLVLAAFVSLVLSAIVLNAFLTNYTPKEKESLSQKGKAKKQAGDVFTFLTWNIGFAGFGTESDFFLDNGKMSIPRKEWSAKNFKGISDVVERSPQIDFFLFQEIDTHAKRSWYINHVEKIASLLPNFAYTFTPNLKVKYIPYPLLDPVGDVESGLASYSRFEAIESTRYRLFGEYNFIYAMFFLKRCMLFERFELENGKELVVINTHKSAYDGGKFKKVQMQLLKSIALKEYNKGNYVVVGGDWNQSPPNFDGNSFLKVGMKASKEESIENDFLPNWQWVYDPSVPTNRKLETPYNPAKTFTTILDFYLISPNLDLVSVRTIDQQFAFSDHQPVYMRVKIKE